ncbi:hypothetical protein CEXT_619271 [Caerostris extrusa]|uniref:Uncharacterized protein n=1 Tax=Caerostris extrusa TaxID=172846 RepID=A0AAV4PSY8_CAEEX|nr:hypothetical protein CEXT_619271 [Caerostris extrusa]
MQPIFNKLTFIPDSLLAGFFSPKAPRLKATICEKKFRTRNAEPLLPGPLECFPPKCQWNEKQFMDLWTRREIPPVIYWLMAGYFYSFAKEHLL